jgi:hypothetical protein
MKGDSNKRPFSCESVLLHTKQDRHAKGNLILNCDSVLKCSEKYLHRRSSVEMYAVHSSKCNFFFSLRFEEFFFFRLILYFCVFVVQGQPSVGH